MRRAWAAYVAVLLAAAALAVTHNNSGSSACAFPSCFPSASNTGYPDGTSLTSYSGANPVTTNNTVIDGKEITTCLEIRAQNVIIKNSYIHYSGSCAEALITLDDSIGSFNNWSVTIQDSTISCGTGWPDATKGSTAIGDAFITGRRLDIFGCENAADVNQSIDVQDSYIHDLMECSAAQCGGDGSHTDGFQMAIGHFEPPGSANVVDGAKNVTIKHNTIFSMKEGAGTPESDASFYTTSTIIQNGSALDHNITIEKNLLAGGGYTLNCEKGGTSAVDSPIIDNHFSTRYASTVGFFGPTAECADETGPVSGNVYHDGANAGQPVPMD